MRKIHVVLCEPRIPQNTGNIGRLCYAAGARLHLIHPLGFEIHQKQIKRAGLDYWQNLELSQWSSLDNFWESHPFSSRHFLLSTKAKKVYYQADFGESSSSETFLYFGREDAGLPAWLLEKYENQVYRIPMQKGVRSINLATSVGAVLYEAIRQMGYDNLE